MMKFWFVFMTLFATQRLRIDCASIIKHVERHEDEGLNFVILGDWGGLPAPVYTTELQKDVADSMGKTAADVNAKFVIALGDNFYYTGVEDDDSARFSKTFQDVYTEKSLQIPWYVIGGNHDHYGNITGQIDYTRLSKIWKFPDYYHSHEFAIPGTSKTLQIILIDTVQLCGNSGRDDHPKPLLGPEFPDMASEQLEWIEKSLASSTADYIIVGGHYPVWSIGHHGPTKQLLEQLKPLLEKYSVNVYMCGHDHNMQVIEEKNSNVQYHVIGNANFKDSRKTHLSSVPEGSSKFFHFDGGYASATVTDEHMVVTFFGADGKMLYQSESEPIKRNHDILV